MYLFLEPPEASQRSADLRAIAGAVMVFSFRLTLVIVMGKRFPWRGSRYASSRPWPRRLNRPVCAAGVCQSVHAGPRGVFLASLVLWKQRAPLALTLAIFAAVPLQSRMAHWADNEQRDHLFGYWFGHDVHAALQQRRQTGLSEMTRDAILYGIARSGRFCPTYTIFCESFIPPECKPRDPKFDRRDVYIITQNALADTLSELHPRSLSSQRAKARRFGYALLPEALRSTAEQERTNRPTSSRAAGCSTAISPVLAKPLKKIAGPEAPSSSRRFLDVNAFAAKLRQPATDFSKELAGMLTPETRALLGAVMPPR